MVECVLQGERSLLVQFFLQELIREGGEGGGGGGGGGGRSH